MLTNPTNKTKVSDKSEQQLQHYFRSGKPEIQRNRSGKHAVHQRPKSRQLHRGLSTRHRNTKAIARPSETSESKSFDSDGHEKQQGYHCQSDYFEMQKSDDSDMSVPATSKRLPYNFYREADDLSDTPNSEEGSEEQKPVVNRKDSQQGRKITSSKKNGQWLKPKHKMYLRSQTTERLETNICTRSCKRQNEMIANLFVNKKNKVTKNTGVKTRGNKGNLQNNRKKTS